METLAPMMSLLPNKAHAVDAPLASLFYILQPLRRATDVHRWATSRIMHRTIPCCLILLVVSCQHSKPTSSWAGSRQNDRIVLMQMFPQVSPEDALRTYPDIDESLLRASWPSTLDQAVTHLANGMDEADKKTPKNTAQVDSILFHSHIRVQNLTGHDLVEVTVTTNAFGALKAGATSEYHPVQDVYQSASVYTKEADGNFRNDRFMGGWNPEIAIGHYTYVLKLGTNDMLQVTLKKEE